MSAGGVLAAVGFWSLLVAFGPAALAVQGTNAADKSKDKERARRIRTEATFREFIFEWVTLSLQELPAQKKKRPHFWGHPFQRGKEAGIRGYQLGVVSGEETTGEKSKIERSVPKGAASSLQDD